MRPDVSQLSNEEFAYLAGIVDGEGSFIISRSKHPDCSERIFVPAMAISNTSPKMISWIRKRIGGALSTRKKGRKWRACYQVHVYPRTLAELLPNLVPFLVVKQEQARTMMRFLSTTKHGAAAYRLSSKERALRLELYTQLKELNHRKRAAQ